MEREHFDHPELRAGAPEDQHEERRLGSARREVFTQHFDDRNRTGAVVRLDGTTENLARALNEMELGILGRLESVRMGLAPSATFSADAALAFGALVAQLLQDGVVPVSFTDEGGHPFGNPFHGFDGIRARAHLLSISLKHVPSTLAETLRFMRTSGRPETCSLAEDAIHVKKIPGFSFGDFNTPTPLQRVREDWDSEEGLGFQYEHRVTTHACIASCIDGQWSESRTIPRVDVAMNLNAQMMHYGSALFEGMNIERGADGEIYVFRMMEHWQRLNDGARMLGMPEIQPFEFFEQMVFETIRANEAYIPPPGKGRLYIRPNYFDSGPHLKVGHSKQCTLAMTAFPIASSEAYFKGSHEKPTRFALATNRARTVLNGVGSAKMAGLYAGTIRDVETCQNSERQYKGLIYSNPKGENARECQAASVIFVKYARTDDGKIDYSGRHTIRFPNMDDGDILDSITMKTVQEQAKDWGFDVEVADTPIDRMQEFDECLALGTAAGATQIHELDLVTLDKEGNPTFDGKQKVQTVQFGGVKKKKGEKKEYGLGLAGRVIARKLIDLKNGKDAKNRGRYLTKVPGTNELLARRAVEEKKAA